MTRLFFLRHTDHDLIGNTVAGRMAGVHLNAIGRERAVRVCERLCKSNVSAVFSSPLERALETAEPLASVLRLPVTILPELNELEMGNWTGRRFSELSDDARWRQWNSVRTSTCPPNGEWMLEVQARALRGVEQMAKVSDCAAVFTHGDVIRAIFCHFLGLHLDLLFRFEIDPGSVSLVELEEGRASVRSLNTSVA